MQWTGLLACSKIASVKVLSSAVENRHIVELSKDGEHTWLYMDPQIVQNLLRNREISTSFRIGFFEFDSFGG
jgi:hypothetical protein